ncbi:hypothetical protein MP228_011479 [Amoeboaphelidium protococcarum]|nr:hypothetical protein MP228_011479 [Amoeboaphelidium protococcarum]
MKRIDDFLLLPDYNDNNNNNTQRRVGLSSVGLQSNGLFHAQYAGHLEVDDIHDGHLFFWLFQSTPSGTLNDTLIIWLNGGPGVSSMDGVLLENGPFRITVNDTIVPNPWSLTQLASVMYVDQPVGTGFSYVFDTENGLMNSVTMAAAEFELFMLHFFRIFSQLGFKRLWIGGESYAGVYIPYFAQQLLQSVTFKQLGVQLEGLILTNPWLDPLRQYASYYHYAKQHGIVSGSDLQKVADAQTKCLKQPSMNNQTTVKVTDRTCDEVTNLILRLNKQSLNASNYLNAYDIRIRGNEDGMDWPPEVDAMQRFLQNSSVVDAINAVDYPGSWGESSNLVYAALKDDSSASTIYMFPKLLRQMRIVVAVGDQDMLCNYIGAEASLVNHLKKSSISLQQWNAQDGAGFRNGNLSYYRVYNASHMFGYDQGGALLRLVNESLHGGNSFNDSIIVGKANNHPKIKDSDHHHKDESSLSKFQALYVIILIAILSAVSVYIWKKYKQYKGRRRYQNFLRQQSIRRNESFELEELQPDDRYQD